MRRGEAVGEREGSHVTARLGRAFEQALWLSRLVVLVPVIFSTLMAFGAFYLASLDALYVLVHLGIYASLITSADVPLDLRSKLVTTIIKATDLYLVAAILLIFALGLYELFISKITMLENSDFARRLLFIRSLDDLKNRLAKVAVLVLVIEFLQQALQLRYSSPLDLLELALGILLVGGALYLSTLGDHD